MTTKKLTIVERIMASLNLGEAGKIQHFFDKQVKNLSREIDGINRNITNLKYNSELRSDELKKKLEDAKSELEASYMNVTKENVETNALQDSFSNVYWNAVERSESKVASLEKDLEKESDSLKDSLKDCEEQIKERQRRIEKIS